jgi:hypothetical protein
MNSAPVAGHSQPAGVLTDCLLVQAEPRDLETVVALADRDGGGLVMTGKNAVEACGSARQRGFSRPLLADRRRYAGNARVPGTAPLTKGWLDAQTAAGTAAVLADSGYVGRGDEAALESVLDQAAAEDAGVVAVLPLHASWLETGRKKLLSEVNAHAVPVALVLEHVKDPLASRAAVRGLIEFLRQSQVPVSLLSTDVSGIGALAFGARWSAVGVRPALRHLYPVREGGWNQFPQVSALIRPLLSVVSVQRIAEAWARTCTSQEWTQDVWTCYCPTCRGRTADWMATASEAEVNAHTFEILGELRDGVSALPPGRIRERSWTSKCNMAVSRYDELRLDLRIGWEAPGYLRSWAALWHR